MLERKYQVAVGQQDLEARRAMEFYLFLGVQNIT